MRLLLFFLFVTTLSAQIPLALRPGERVVLIGNSLFDNMRRHGQFEAMLQQRFAKEGITLRNLAWSADEITLRPRPDEFGDLNQHLAEQKADVILAAFGFNESFRGVPAIPEFETLLKAFLIELKSHRYNGTSTPRIVLVSPIAVEDLGPPLPAAKPINDRLAVYAGAMRKTAKAEDVGFVDVLTPGLEHAATLARSMAAKGGGALLFQLTDNGIHLNTRGYEFFAAELYRGLFDETAPMVNPALQSAVEEKEKQFFYRYRPLNGYYITGGRKDPYGVVNFPGELRKLDDMVANRDARIHTIAQGKTVPEKIDDTNTESLPAITGDRPINEWLSAADELKAFKIDPRFEVNCFVSEEDFPEFMKPISIRWDARGRLWVSTSVTYPQIIPGQEPQDKILILEDTNHDGRADTCKVWADKLQIPLSFELDGKGGVYCSEQPNLIYLQDTDGDDRADVKKVLLTGFGTEDSHHSLHDFAWTPDGDLIFRESIFHHSQVETAYGPVRARDSSFFRYNPATQKLIAFGSYMSTNPWGLTFDDWGFHVGSHPVFAEAVHALNAPYPDQHVPAGAYFPAYSGTCGHEFLHNAHWGKEFHNHFARVRYKPTNEIELHEWVEKDTHFEEKKVGQILQSSNLSFIPVDCRCGPDGALYVADWYNPVKGHMQYSLRDTRRDKKSGRIWRVAKKDAPLLEPVKIAGEPVEKLLELLKSDNQRTRYLARMELRGWDVYDVAARLQQWLDRPEIVLEPVYPPFAGTPPASKPLDSFVQTELLWLMTSVLGRAEGTQSMPPHVSNKASVMELKNWMQSVEGQAWAQKAGSIGGIDVYWQTIVMCLFRDKSFLARAACIRDFGRRSPADFDDLVRLNERWKLPESFALLQAAANDPSGLVRLEAAIAASYIGTPAALEATLDLLTHPMDEYLTYALRTALDSYTLKPLWFNNAAFAAKHPELGKFLKDSEPKKPAQMAKKKKAEQPDPFDAQPGLRSIFVSTVPERMLFTNREFTVKAKAPVKLIFDNPDVTAHNLVIVQPGAADEVGLAGNEMAKDSNGLAKGFVPDSKKILQATKLLNQGDTQTLRFMAPESPGRYPFICTFPGHWLVMKGEMVVE